MASLRISVPCRPRQSHLTLSIVHRRAFSKSPTTCSSQYDRSDLQGQPFSASYDPEQPTQGPLGGVSSHGAPQITPRKLKAYLDRHVVGQERPKKMMAVAVYNHYQRIRELRRQEEEEKERLAKLMRTKYNRSAVHPVEEEFPGQIPTVNFNDSSRGPDPPNHLGELPFEEINPVTIEKSNIMMLGPTGVGKTLIAKNLAKLLDVPFSISNCTAFTQAGYVGEDAEAAVHRLFTESGNDVAATEMGIIVLDEVDKLALSKVTNGKDVGGEGVQQALLKIIEGTTLSVTVKSDRGSRSSSNPFPPGFGAGNAGGGALGSAGAQKTETFLIRTDNILFIFAGAFNGLENIILNRVNKGSMGFGSPVRSKPSENPANTSNPHDLDPELFHKGLPFYAKPSVTQDSAKVSDENIYNPLDLVTPVDFQNFGLIPEFIGRIPIRTALSSLSISQIVRILTEPRNSITAQYISLLATSGAELRFTSGAIHAMARRAHSQGTGARGLRTVVESVLAKTMYEVPGSSVKFVLVTEAAVNGDEHGVGYWARGQAAKFHGAIAAEEEAWERKKSAERGEKEEGETESHSFEEFRDKATSGL